MATPSVANHGFKGGLTVDEMRKANSENFNVVLGGRRMRQPDRIIYIHSVAKRDFPVRTFLFPRLNLKGCSGGERYVTCTTLPDPVLQPSPDQERGGTRVDEHDGWRAAIDMLNPSNLTADPYTGSDNPSFYGNRNGTNLIAEGFWPSFNEEPTEEEIRRAERHRDSRFRYLTAEAMRLAAVSTRELNEFLQRFPDTHMAMDALGLAAPWHQKNDVRAVCPNCGEPIKQGVAFHKLGDIICVLDPERAFKAGAITREKYEDLAGIEPAKRGPGRPRKEEV